MSARKRKRKYGTIVRYSLKAPARVQFRVERKRKCRKGKSRRKCNPYKALKGSFRHTGKAGTNKFRFNGRIGGKKLKPGVYYLAAKPTLGKATGKIKRKRFRIVRP